MRASYDSNPFCLFQWSIAFLTMWGLFLCRCCCCHTIAVRLIVSFIVLQYTLWLIALTMDYLTKYPMLLQIITFSWLDEKKKNIHVCCGLSENSGCRFVGRTHLTSFIHSHRARFGFSLSKGRRGMIILLLFFVFIDYSFIDFERLNSMRTYLNLVVGGFQRCKCHFNMDDDGANGSCLLSNQLIEPNGQKQNVWRQF